MMHIYKKCVENTEISSYRIAVSQFVIFLMLYVSLSYASTLLAINENEDDLLTQTYEKYVILVTALYMILPFSLSCILILGLLHKHLLCIKVWLQSSVTCMGILVVAEFGSGIFIAVKGTMYIGCCLILGCMILFAYMSHSLFVINEVYKKYAEEIDSSNEPEMRNSGEFSL